MVEQNGFEPLASGFRHKSTHQCSIQTELLFRVTEMPFCGTFIGVISQPYGGYHCLYLP